MARRGDDLAQLRLRVQRLGWAPPAGPHVSRAADLCAAGAGGQHAWHRRAGPAKSASALEVGARGRRAPSPWAGLLADALLLATNALPAARWRPATQRTRQAGGVRGPAAARAVRGLPCPASWQCCVAGGAGGAGCLATVRESSSLECHGVAVALPACLQVMLPQIKRALAEAQTALAAAEREHRASTSAIHAKEKQRRWTKF